MHVGYDVGQGWAGEELEAALGILDAGGSRRGGEAEEEVEGMHEEVAEFGALKQRCEVKKKSLVIFKLLVIGVIVMNRMHYLDHGFTADEMSSGTDCNGPPALIFNLDTFAHQKIQIVEIACSVCVREQNVSASCVPHSVHDCAAFASVLFQRDDANRFRRDLCRSCRVRGAWARYRIWLGVRLVITGEF